MIGLGQQTGILVAAERADFAVPDGEDMHPVVFSGHDAGGVEDAIE